MNNQMTNDKHDFKGCIENTPPVGDIMTDTKQIVYIILMLAAVALGHFVTINGVPDAIQCFAPLEVK